MPPKANSSSFAMASIRTLTFVAGAIGLWEWLGRTSNSFRLIVSTPTQIADYSLLRWERLSNDMVYTIAEASSGLILASLLAMLLTTACIMSRRALAAITPAVRAVQIVPIIVFAPFITMILPIGLPANIAMATLVGVFPMIGLLVDAYSRLPENLFDLVKVYKISPQTAWRRIYLPLLMPTVFSSLRLSSALCIVGAVVAEFTGARYGLGRNIFEASIRIEPELMMISVLAVILIGMAFNFVITRVERSVVRWRH